MSNFSDLEQSCFGNSYQFKNAIERGTFYYPAWKHYGSTKANVVCDRCSKNNLVSCIGYGNNLDLCLNCVQAITEMLYETDPIYSCSEPVYPYIHPASIENPIPPCIEHSVTRMRPGLYKSREIPLTLMSQNMFKDEPRTYMKQNIFRRSNETDYL